ncbi:2-hydroxyacid dehydrogenase [Steroidobacter denitrificans]|uniref:2-hydroxyacid dehydrogenase n=2 Tax=Steroidobacter denitrificans TaxID=465721 RepID=A0A127F6K7_STEDE|nr:2-hydroxyacid dehydrogenase [Steroidobacter denitrificans]
MVGQGEFLLYQTEDAQTRIQLRLDEGTVWMSQKQLADLYQVRVPTINAHLKNLFRDGELAADRTIRKFLIVAREGTRAVERLVDHYNLEVILHLGYRVRSHRGAQFRRWATEQLKSYLGKGFLLDDERFKGEQDSGYFEELLARIRDIRSSEKEFWRKVLDIYATSIDYDPHAETSQQFFATVQNKMHWAAHGHTAAELIVQRVDAQAPHMGLTSWAGASRGAPVRKADVGVAKNYLNAEELDTLNRIVTAYIEVAELQAQARQPMTMRDWAKELDDFLRLTRKDILTNAGTVSAEAALSKAQAVYAEYQQQIRALPSQAEKDFEAAIAQPVKRIEKSRKALPKKRPGGEE